MSQEKTTRMALCVLLLFIITSTFFANAKAGLKRLKNRTNVLEQQVVLLNNDVAELKKHVNYLNHSLHTLCHCKYDSDNTTINIPVEANKTISEFNKTTSYHGLFRVLRISRINIGAGKVNHTVAVNHIASIPNLFSYWNRLNNDDSFTPLNYGSNPKPSVLGAANTTASVVTNAENHTSVLFVFGVAEVWYALRLNNSNSQNITMTNISTPEIYVMPKEVVYPIGENASFQLISSNYGDFSISDKILTQAGTDEFVTSYHGFGYSSSKFNQHDSNNTKIDGKVTDITLDMSSLQLSGVVTFKTSTKDYNSSILEGIEIYRRCVIRPSNQSGPFVGDMFVFYTDLMRKDEDGRVFHICQTGFSCPLVCPPVVGSNKTRTVIWHWDRKDKDVRVEIASPRIDANPVYVSELFVAEIPEGLNEVFCEATNLVSETTITQGFKIEWLLPSA